MYELRSLQFYIMALVICVILSVEAVTNLWIFFLFDRASMI